MTSIFTITKFVKSLFSIYKYSWVGVKYLVFDNNKIKTSKDRVVLLTRCLSVLSFLYKEILVLSLFLASLGSLSGDFLVRYTERVLSFSESCRIQYWLSV